MLITNNLATELALALAEAEEVWVAVALLNEHGTQFLRQHTKPTVPIQLLLGVAPAALTQLMAWPSATARLYGGTHTYHPKVHVMRQGTAYTAFIGSANATADGLA